MDYKLVKMNYKKFERIKVRKEFDGLINRDIPHRKQIIRKLSTIKVRHEKNDHPKFYRPLDYSKNKTLQIL